MKKDETKRNKIKVFNAATDIYSKMNRKKQRASPRFAHATAAPSWIMSSFRLVIKSTLFSFDLFLTSESYSPIVNAVMH